MINQLVAVNAPHCLYRVLYFELRLSTKCSNGITVLEGHRVAQIFIDDNDLLFADWVNRKKHKNYLINF